MKKIETVYNVNGVKNHVGYTVNSEGDEPCKPIARSRFTKLVMESNNVTKPKRVGCNWEFEGTPASIKSTVERIKSYYPMYNIKVYAPFKFYSYETGEYFNAQKVIVHASGQGWRENIESRLASLISHVPLNTK